MYQKETAIIVPERHCTGRLATYSTNALTKRLQQAKEE